MFPSNSISIRSYTNVRAYGLFCVDICQPASTRSNLLPGKGVFHEGWRINLGRMTLGTKIAAPVELLRFLALRINIVAVANFFGFFFFEVLWRMTAHTAVFIKIDTFFADLVRNARGLQLPGTLKTTILCDNPFLFDMFGPGIERIVTT